MLRRKLALYVLLYIAGIAAGYFIFEKTRIPEGLGFCAAVITAVLLTENNSKSRTFLKRDHEHIKGGAEKHLNYSSERIKEQKRILIFVFVAGLLLFSFRYMGYKSALSGISSLEQAEGRILSVSVKNDSVQLIIAGPSRMLVITDEDTVNRLFQQDGSSATHLSERSLICTSLTGATVKAKGQFSEIPPADNPGCFDYSLYMKGKGVNVRLRAYSLELIDSDDSLTTSIRRYLYATRESFIGRFDNETSGFIRGVIFGDKSEIDVEILDEFNANSTGHILAVSGLHIGFLYGLLRFLTSRKRTLPASMLIAAVILLYGEMTTWSPATVRACIVLTVSLLSSVFRRRSDLLTSVSLAAFIILTFQPYQLFSSGFQLSFLALCGIAFLTKPIASVTGEAIAVMIAVQIGTLPVIAYSYCSINPLSILINIPVILLASLLVPLCILLLMTEACAGTAPGTGIEFAELISYTAIKVNHLLSFGGSFSIRTAGPGTAVIILIYVLIFGLASEWTRVMVIRHDAKLIIMQGMLILMPLLMLFSCLYNPLSDDEIVFVAVGQGDCTHIRASGNDILIDGGGQQNNSKGSTGKESTDEFNVGEKILMPYLLHSGAENIEIALVTHLHTDHYKGITELSEIYPVGAIGIPSDYRGSVNGAVYIDPGTKIDIADEVYVETIWPVEKSTEPVAADDPNEHNAVYMIHYKGIKAMITGDLLEEDEHEMVEYYKGTDTLKCDILKVAHHGSKSSSSEEFLDAAAPQVAVIQCGRNNIYGHPHKQTLDRLEARGIRTFRTDISGAVGIDIRGGYISVDLIPGRNNPHVLLTCIRQ